jgi:pilus assembly protein CpaC
MTHNLEIATSRRSTSLRRTAAVGLLSILPLCLTAAGQDGGASQDALGFKVSDAEQAGRLINVPVNKSRLIDFDHPVREVRMVNDEIATVRATTPKQLVVSGKTFGVTQMIVWVDEKTQHVFDVAVDLELERLQASIRSAVPRARVKAYGVLDSVVLTGKVPDAASAQRIMQIAGIYSPRIIDQMVVAGTQQVLLRCTVAEVNRTAVRQLGFNGWVAGDNFGDMFGLSNLAGINPTNIGAAADVNVTGKIPFLTGPSGIPVTGSTTLSFGFPRGQMQFFVQALNENGLLRVLAEPNLVALSGQEATFLVGGQIPIPIVTNDRIKVEYHSFGVQLNFTATVLDDGRIRLRVVPEISEPDFSNAVTVGGFAIPAFTSRRVETVVEMGSGETIAIGGLLSERIQALSRKIPGLGDIPILGSLFSSNEFRSEQTELVVLVTPELAESVSPDQVTYVPGANMLAPNDFEFYFLGKLEGEPDEGRPVLRPRVNNHWPVKPDELYGDDALSLKLRGPLGPAGFEEGA